MSKTDNGRSLRVTEAFLRENFSEVLLAAREGRLLLKPRERQAPQRAEVIRSVRTYVRQIDGLAQPRWAGRVGRLWEEILGKEDLVDLLMPGPKTRKCREFNKYGVMRMVGVLRSHGVYDACMNDSQLCEALEHTAKDSAYRSYIGMGLESRQQLRLMIEVLNDLTL